jgi:hypothetical protein
MYMNRINKTPFPIFFIIISCCVSQKGFSQFKTSDSSNKKSKTQWTWKGKPVTEKQLMDSMGVTFKKYNDSISKADHLIPRKPLSKQDTSK